MTASEEATSKYFSKVQKVSRKAAPPGPEDTRSADTTSPSGLSTGAPKFQPDLSSDSPLSDVPSDVSSILDKPAPDSSPQASPREDPVTTPPTPAEASPPESARPPRPRAKLPTVSPYFPKPPRDAESCLPFPPISAPSFGLIQEQLAHDPFRLLIATIFLNRTRGGVAIPVLFRVFERYPTVDAMAAADQDDLVSLIHSLGFQNQRAKRCIALAQTWLAAPPTKGRRYRKLHYPRTNDGRDVAPDECVPDDEDDSRVAWEIAHLPGIGRYAIDSWRIFCRDALRGLAADWKGTGATSPDFQPEWKKVLPRDKELRAYLAWMWLREGWVWDRETGARTRASEEVMRAAERGGIAREDADGRWVLETSPVRRVENGLHG